jgi:hypothetical protein
VAAEIADRLDDEARVEVEAALIKTLEAPRADPSIIYKDVWT